MLLATKYCTFKTDRAGAKWNGEVSKYRRVEYSGTALKKAEK
jgi:hypothetical protein